MDRISAHCLEAADESVTEVGAAAVADAVGPHFLGRHACRASRLPLIQTEYRPSAPLHHRGHLLKTPRGTSKGIEALEADQGVQHIDRLVEGCFDRACVLAGQPPDENLQTLSSPVIPCPYHLLEVWVECGQGSESTRDEPISVPEPTEDCDVSVQGIEGVRLTECGSELLHASLSCKDIGQGLQQPNLEPNW